MTHLPVNLIHVGLRFDDRTQNVGRLATVNRRIYFEYDVDFLKSGLDLSPFQLPLKAGAVPCADGVFQGLFGVFNDSLPDGWGRLLLDRRVRKLGIAPERLTPLDRLMHVGAHGMGALVYEPDADASLSLVAALDLDKLAAETEAVLEGAAEDVFIELLALSGSSAGARPKVMVVVGNDKQHLLHGRRQLPDGYTHWMVKFAASTDAQDIGAIEYAYSLMARAAGLNMMPTHLFPARNGAGYFGVERFDRCGNQRIHMHTVSGLLHADHRLPALDYEQIMRLTLALTRDVREVEKILLLAAFNVFAHNRDDHAKNFAFLMDAQGRWRVAPAYDLTFSGGPGGEHSTTVMGEGKNPGPEHLIALAEAFGVSARRARPMIDGVAEAVRSWPEFAATAGVGRSSRELIANVIAR